ncbi:chemotaxis response regulator protein-glutamate methylesterase [Leptolyngbya sp. 'hensonii']|uniref:chemotaxis-specific protein-glutamate methyltransferase CheB n=1 Tax=Leptolyngbya sp. 'hensonii' TaxID=1922337 RepID=UPI0009503133|nr:chemotaxis-specific protein-glutamate methyltransferase CheB [Leptolyngbya sp. 'hensonii']OLP17106.1 chemotaxis response regulator protein-glutamate methylesterase [Leptolyngbya sp. 'hensonii']
MAVPIRVLLVEDSPVVLTILRRLLAETPDMEIVGTAHNGIEALALIPQVNPTVICTDLHMPKMGGLELTRRVMAECPRPILVISASVQAEDSHTVFQLLQAGALDVFPKPRTGLSSEYEQMKIDLLNRIRVLAGVSVFTRRPASSSEIKPVPLPSSLPAISVPRDICFPRVVAIGASTGGPQAMHTILSQIPRSFAVPILCVQHISEGFLTGLVNWLAAECSLKVRIAQPGEIPQVGTVYFPPERCHLQLDPHGRFLLPQGPPVAGHCPSATILFRSVAAYYRRSAVGILLTGMGRDGAEGLAELAQASGITIAQDEASCVVFGMPKEAIALGAVQQVLPLDQIAPILLHKIFAPL